MTQHYSLVVVRLADPAHAQLASLALRSSDGSSVLLCGTADVQQPDAAASAAKLLANSPPGNSSTSANATSLAALKQLVASSKGKLAPLMPTTKACAPGGCTACAGLQCIGISAAAAGPCSRLGYPSSHLDSCSLVATPELSCVGQRQRTGSLTTPLHGYPHHFSCLNRPALTAGVTMSVNVSYATELVTLSPTLMFPGEPGVRVEVNGQVRGALQERLRLWARTQRGGRCHSS